MNSEEERRILEGLKRISADLYRSSLDSFKALLTPYEQAVYESAQFIPYGPRSWYRDLHDVVVASAAVALAKAEGISRHLVLAALLHDRGYAILERLGDRRESSPEYLTKKGAYWQDAGTRVWHSRLSREVSQVVLGNEGLSTTLASVQPGLRFVQGGGLSASDLEGLYQVIEYHDHALIGEYEKLSPLGRHHFDVDSLYSLSPVSFLKDLLSYREDNEQISKFRRIGLIKGASLSPRELLVYRLARYYKDRGQLPDGWDTSEFPLVREYSSSNETGCCITPHSQWAIRSTGSAFRLLCDISAAFEDSPEAEVILALTERLMCETLHDFGVSP